MRELFLNNYPPQTRFAESYRTLTTNISFSKVDRELRSLLVTSAIEQEGKTTTAINLAYSMAQTGKSVLMIDADLRKPTLSNLIPSNNSPGLSGLLSDAFNVDAKSGSLSEFGVSDLLWLYSFQKRTGILHLTEGEEKIDIYFLNGELADVYWLTRPRERMMASQLVATGLLTQEQAEEALLRRQSTGQKLGFILITMGLIKEQDLAGIITLHMIEGFRTALLFKSGNFSFEPLAESFFDRPSYNPTDLPKIYRQLILGEEELPFLNRKITAAVMPTGVENLSILPCGHRPPKPAELLGSNRMSFLLSFLKKRFDVLIIDTPPVLPASDALLLGSQTDGIILAVKAGHANRTIIKKAVEQMQTAKANILGVVLNQVDVKKEGYYKYYQKYYSAYYGEAQ